MKLKDVKEANRLTEILKSLQSETLEVLITPQGKYLDKLHLQFINNEFGQDKPFREFKGKLIAEVGKQLQALGVEL